MTGRSEKSSEDNVLQRNASAAGQTRAVEQAAIFSALGDPTRLDLLARLSVGQPLSIATLSADGRMTRQAVTKHLGVLERAGLVAHERMGRESRFAYRPGPVAQAQGYLNMVAGQWEGALWRLKARAEG